MFNTDKYNHVFSIKNKKGLLGFNNGLLVIFLYRYSVIVGLRFTTIYVLCQRQ